MAQKFDAHLLHGAWRHIAAEDTSDTMVFRPAGVSQAPSRGAAQLFERSGGGAGRHLDRPGRRTRTRERHVAARRPGWRPARTTTRVGRDTPADNRRTREGSPRREEGLTADPAKCARHFSKS